MKIKQITSQTRRDFSAILICEGCGNEQQLWGVYDDNYYHDKVIPTKRCEKCGKTRNDLGITSERTETKYQDWETV